jgi:CHAD domain-containing protein
MTKPELDLAAGTTAGDAFAQIFGELLAALRATIDGTLTHSDPEDLHDFRVAVRRTRAALKLAGDVLDRDLASSYAEEFRWLGSVTSPSRDLDVQLQGYDDLVAGVEHPGSLAPFRQKLEQQQRDAHAELDRHLRSDRFAALLLDWERDLTSVASGPSADEAVTTIAHRRLEKAWRKVHQRGRALDADGPPEALHDLRKRCKELRYLLEFFASLHDPEAHRSLVKALKRLQDNLGSFQDHVTQRRVVAEHVATLTAASAPTATLQSLEGLDRRLAAAQRAARAEFGERWAAFDHPRNQRAYHLLVG